MVTHATPVRYRRSPLACEEPVMDQLQRIPLKQLFESPSNPRKAFGDIAELARTIDEQGLIEPVIVRPREVGGFWITAGHRRARALKLLGHKDAECIVRKATESQALQAMLVENKDRESLNALEVADGYQRLMDEHKMTGDEVAKQVGVSRASVYAATGLLRLTEPVQKALLHGEISASSAVEIGRVQGERLQAQALSDALKLARDGEKPAQRAVQRLIKAKYIDNTKRQLSKKERARRVNSEEVALRRRVLPYMVARLEQMVERKAMPEDLVLRLQAQALANLGDAAREVYRRRGERPDRLSKVGAAQLKALVAGLCFTLSATLTEDGEYTPAAKALAKAAGLAMSEMESAVESVANAEALFEKE